MSGSVETNSKVASRTICVLLFGGFRLVNAGRLIRLPGCCQRLIAFLAFRSRTARVELAGSLWPNVTDARALGSLRTSVWQIRRRCAGLLATNGDQLKLSEYVHVDIIDFKKRAGQILRQPQNASLMELMCGWQELLPGWYDDWVLLERERSRQLQLHVLEAAGEELLARRKHGPALSVALDAVQVEPLRESARRLVIRIHISEGNICEAVRHYQMYLRLLRDELGVPPTHQLENLVIDLIFSSSSQPDRIANYPNDEQVRVACSASGIERGQLERVSNANSRLSRNGVLTRGARAAR